MNNTGYVSYPVKLLFLFLFAVTMANVEAMIVVYLREAFYPGGFAFPLKLLPERVLLYEIVREAATILMLAAVAFLSGVTRWERFAYFLGLFGVWDIFYYVWLKLVINWPLTLVEWDVLFLIPLPWIGPVIAPVLVAIWMLGGCGLILWLIKTGHEIRISKVAVSLSILGTMVILYSFMYDTSATLALQMPQPYPYYQLIIGLACYTFALIFLFRQSRQAGKSVSTPSLQ